jgi:hypothetical protein
MLHKVKSKNCSGTQGAEKPPEGLSIHHGGSDVEFLAT